MTQRFVFGAIYSIVRLAHSRHGGGLIIYVNNIIIILHCLEETVSLNLLYSVVSHSQTTLTYILLLFIDHLTLIIIIISLFETLFFSVLCTFSPNVFINLVIVGDFNINYLSTPNYFHDRLSSVMSSFNLLQVVSEPTRISTTSSLTDLVFCFLS